MQTAVPERADLIFVFGTRRREPARIAADLVTRGIGRTLVLTGGKNRLTGVEEANTHLGIVLKSGVPRDHIIVEDTSSNTLENVIFALPKVATCVDLDTIGSIVVVAKWYHCRRAMMTLRRHFPAGVRYLAATYKPQGMGRSEWRQSEQGARSVLKEMDRILRYLESGDIAEIREEDGAYV